MKNALRRLFTAPSFADDEQQRLALALNIILWAGAILTFAYIVASLLLPPSPFLHIPSELAVLALHALCILLMRRGQPKIAAAIYVGALWLIISASLLFLQEITSTGVSTFYTVILIAGVLLGARGSFTLAALSAIAIVVNIVALEAGDLESTDWMPAITLTVNFALVAVVAWIGQRSIITSLTAASSTRSLLDRRSAQLQAAADIGTATAKSQDLHALMETITQVIADRFGFYHVSIFTHDPQKQELSLSAISQGGQKVSHTVTLKMETKQLRSIIAHVARTQKPYLAKDVASDPLYMPHPQLDKAKSELAVPILAGGTLFGVLDVLSSSDTPLGNDELNALVLLGNQVGAARHCHRSQRSRQRR
jgi:putative methionine-R-sulfoxide reductase with GAF domain